MLLITDQNRVAHGRRELEEEVLKTSALQIVDPPTVSRISDLQRPLATS